MEAAAVFGVLVQVLERVDGHELGVFLDGRRHGDGAEG